MQTLTIPSLQSFIRPFKEFIFPPRCFSCDNPLYDSDSRVCPACWSSIRYVLQTDDLYRETKGKLVASGYVAGLVSLCYFDPDGPVQSLIHELKYTGMTSLGEEFGRKLGDALTSSRGYTHIDGLIPVPLHKAKLRERGYNQSEYVSKGISSVTGIPVLARFLERTRYTPSQTALDIEERRQNVHEAFALNPSFHSDLTGKSFVVVDDVITTGATIVECARVLKQHGAEQVIACSVALAP